MIEPSKTLMCCLTPPAAGAIATLALRGPGALDLLEELFQPNQKSCAHEYWAKLRDHPQSGRFQLGKLGEPDQPKDEVVLALKNSDPVPSFEIHCHGGTHVIAMLQEAIASRGAVLCSWQEFHKRTEANPLQTAAVSAMNGAVTCRSAAILLDQYHGALENAVRAILCDLEKEKYESAIALLRGITYWNHLGKHLTTPWRVAVAGAPNVGKSSLINKLAGYDRCIVSVTPGTTRDLVSTCISIDGWPVELIDTAGIRAEAEELEEQGIALAKEATVGADLCLWLVEASAAPIWPEQEFANHMIIVNKIDLPLHWDLEKVPNAVKTSATSGAGLNDLLNAIADRLVPEVPPPGAAAPFTADQCRRLESALDHCRNADWDAGKEQMHRLLHVE